MDDFKKNLIRDHVELAAIVIGGINSFTTANPVSKFKTCIQLGKSVLDSTFNDSYFESTSNMLNNAFSESSDLRKFYAAIEEIYVNDFVDFKSVDKGDIEGLAKLVEEFLVKQDEDDYVDPEVAAEVDQMVRDIEQGKDFDDNEIVDNDPDFANANYDIDDDFDDGYGADELT